MSEDRNLCVFGIFPSRALLENCIASLKAQGFRNTDISVLLAERNLNDLLAHRKSTKAPEGVAAASAGGVVLGGVLGWLAGMGALTVPGVGPFIAAGPLMSLLAGVGIGGVFGGIAGGLVGLGIPEYEAKKYETFVKDGGLLISVHVRNSEAKKIAKETLEICGARDIASAREEKMAEDHLARRPILPPTSYPNILR